MTPGGKVSFSYEWERTLPNDDGECQYLMVEVEAEITDYHPEVRTTRGGDPGWEAEGGEIASMVVTLPDGKVLSPIPGKLYEELTEQAIEEHYQNVGDRT